MKELFTESELKRLLALEEGQFLEFKSLWHLEDDKPKPLERRTVRDWIAEYVAAFANADGGTIVLGVDDDGTPTGHAYPEDAVREFLAVPISCGTFVLRVLSTSALNRTQILRSLKR